MNILNILVQIIIALLVIAEIAGIVVGIVFFVKIFTDKDVSKRTRNILVSLGSVLGPLLLLFITLSVWGFINIAAHTATR